MKTAIPVYSSLLLTSEEAAYKAQVVCVDLNDFNAADMFLHVRVTNGTIPPQQGSDFDIHYAFSPFDFRSDLADTPNICAISYNELEIALQGGIGKAKAYSSEKIAIEARYLYVWLNYARFSQVHNATLTLDVIAMVSEPSGPVAGSVLRRESTALTNNLLMKTGPGRLYNFYGLSTKPSVQYIQLFDSATLPDEGTAPIAVFAVDANDNFGLDIPVTGLPFVNGLVACNSTEPAEKAIGLEDCFFYATLT